MDRCDTDLDLRRREDVPSRPTGDRHDAIDVLVVDDNGGVRALLRRLGQRDGQLRFVAEAADGMEAIAAAEAHQPDVVILDVDMPVLDGISAIAGILQAAPHTRILMYSAFGERRDQAIASGAHGWATKGQSWNEIRDLISEVLVRSPAT